MPKYCLRIVNRATNESKNATINVNGALEAVLAGVSIHGRSVFAKSGNCKPREREVCVTIEDIRTGERGKSSIVLGSAPGHKGMELMK